MSLCYLNDLLKDLGVELGAILGLDKQVRARDLLGGVQLVRLSRVDKFNHKRPEATNTSDEPALLGI